MGIEIFQKHIREKRAVKVVAGESNFDLENVAKIARAAQRGKASAIDVACRKDVIETARKNSKLPIFASSIHPFEILEAVKSGVDAIEIGTYESAYKKGYTYTYSQIYDIILETFGLINNYDVYKCVTIPMCLNSSDRIKLLAELEILGVDLVQTEGFKMIDPKNHVFVKDANASINKAVEVIRNSRIPVVSTCSMDEKTAQYAFSQGVDGVSIGSFVKKQDTEIAMASKITEIVSNISHRNSLNREIVRNATELKFLKF
ncbi:MAG: DUF561 domain-containing protein [Candidatus Gastranaerophilales bacterium]|nr:DUF561 domain-containing protein [Candidatus Gastranaerophilales bacterium]